MLNNETKAIIYKISKADGNYTIATNVMFITTGVMFSRNNIYHLSGLFNELENLDGTNELNSIARIDYIKKKEFNHMVLYYDGNHNQLINTYQDEFKKQWLNLPPQEDKDLQHSLIHIDKFLVLDIIKHFYRCGMGYTHGTTFFDHFPEVIYVNTSLC